MSVVGSASGDGCNPSFCNRARMKRSMALRAHFSFFTFGGSDRMGG
jgi:hypothetical protein